MRSSAWYKKGVGESKFVVEKRGERGGKEWRTSVELKTSFSSQLLVPFPSLPSLLQLQSRSTKVKHSR